MKVLPLLLGAPLATQAAAIEKRQLGGLEGLLSGAASLFMDNMKAAKVVDGTSGMKRQGVKNIRVYHGPLKLLPAEEASKIKGVKSDPNSNPFWVNLQGFPQNSWILRTNSTLQYENGSMATIASDVFNHHVQFFDVGKSSDQTFQCGSTVDPSKAKSGFRMPGGYIGGSAADGAPAIFNTPDGMFNSGYFLSNKSNVIMSAELVNYGKEPKSIYAVTEIDYLPGDTPGMMDTTVGIMTVNQCDPAPNPFLQPPRGKKVFDIKSKEITIIQDGYMLSRRGHMHDGGTGMVLKVNDNVVCDSKGEYGADGTFKTEDGKEWKALSGMKECNEPVPVKKGDILKIEAYFDLERHPPRKHAHGGGDAEMMALMGFVFAFKKPGIKI